VEEIVIGLNNNVDYAILTSDEGLLDIGDDQMVAVPLSTLQAGTEDGTFHFSGDPLVFQNAPTFTEDQWASLADPTWDDSFFDFWQSQEELALMPETGGESAVTGPAFIRASELMDEDVVNTAGEDLGNVEDLVLNPQPNSQDYAVISFEAFEEIGPDQLYAIPLNQLNFADVQGDNLFTFDTDPTMLQNMPSFTADTWPVFTDPAAGAAGATSEMTAEGQAPLRISELTGDAILNANGEDLGQIQDVVIGLQSDTDYAIVALEQSLFDLTEETLVAIPMTALTLNAEAEAFSFAGDQAILQNAPTFTESQWENLTDPTWDDGFFEFWEDEGLLVPSGVLPAEAETGETTTTDDTTAAAPGEMQGAAFVSAAGLMDQEVLDSAGEAIGNVQDVILSGQQNGTNYAVMAFDFADELGGNLYLVPVDQLNFSTTAEGDNVLTFNADPTILQNAPVFNEDDWDNFITNPTWDEEFRDFWGTKVAE
jgi:sporulation protein YlmC with PRC-barrel domain